MSTRRGRAEVYLEEINVCKNVKHYVTVCVFLPDLRHSFELDLQHHPIRQTGNPRTTKRARLVLRASVDRRDTVGWDTVQLDVACPSEVASQALNMGWRGEGGWLTNTHTHTHTEQYKGQPPSS